MIARLGPRGQALWRTPVPILAASVMMGCVYALVFELLPPRDALLLSVPLAAFLASLVGQSVGGSLAALAFALAGGAVMFYADALWVSRPLWGAALIAAALVAPLTTSFMSPQGAWRRLVRQITAAALALLGASIVFGGVFVVEVSVEALLGLDVPDVTNRVVMPAAFGLLAPIVFLALSGLEEAPQEDRVSDALGLVAQTFARLVLVPLLALYAVVLAAYVARIAIIEALPSGEVGWIVPLFAVSGAATFLALASQEREGAVTRTFMRVWFPLTLPALALFAVALAIRIDAYGLTPQRYLAAAAGVWLVAIGLGFTVGGSRSDVRLIPVTGALVLFLSAIGPWSMVPLVARSQADAVRAALPAGSVPGRLRTMDVEQRARVCSSVRTLDRVERLRAVEVALAVGDPGLSAMCVEPFGAADPDIRIAFESADDVLKLPDGRLVWGPLTLFEDVNSLNAQSAALSVALVGSSVVVSAPVGREAFDLAAAARAWRADPTSGDLRLSGEAITLVLRQLSMILPPEGPVVRYARLIVVVDPPDESVSDAQPETGATSEPTPADP